MSIKLTNLKINKSQSNISLDYIYNDLHLDLKTNFTINNQLFKNNERKDLVLDYDNNAIKNSISNIFNTMPGQKILSPEFGLNLNRFLFQPISQSNGNEIGNAILIGLQLYEPRIIIQNINVEVDEDNEQYNITISYKLPTLKSDVYKLYGVLNKNTQFFNINYGN